MKTPAVPIPVSGNTSTPLVAAKADFATAIRNPSMTSGKDINAQKDECKSPRSYDDMRETSNPASATLSSPKKTAHVKSEDRTKSYVPAQTYGLPDDINMNSKSKILSLYQHLQLTFASSSRRQQQELEPGRTRPQRPLKEPHHARRLVQFRSQCFQGRRGGAEGQGHERGSSCQGRRWI